MMRVAGLLLCGLLFGLADGDEVTKMTESLLKGLWEKLVEVRECRGVIKGEESRDEISLEFLENTPWLPKWMNVSEEPEEFTGFRVVRGDAGWCGEDIGKLEVLGEVETDGNCSSLSEDYWTSISLNANGSLSLVNDTEQINLNSSEFCLTQLNSGMIRFKRCSRLCPEGLTCFRKCCPPHEVLTIVEGSNMECVPSKTQWTPEFYHKANVKVSTSEIPPEFLMFTGFPPCEPKYFVQSNVDNQNPNLLLNGTLLLLTSRVHAPQLTLKVTPIKPLEFCIDGFGEKVSGENETKVARYSRSEWHQMIVACTPPKLEVPAWIPPVYAFFNHTAALFLFVTAVIYLILWSHQNIHGWLQFAYALSLFFAYTFLAIVQIWSHKIDELYKPLCAYLGCLIQFTFLSAFFWLTSVNFDVWWRFSGRRSLRRIRPKPCRERVKRFLVFACISWGVPTLISGGTMTLDIVYKDCPHEAPLKLPRFGYEKCYFEDKSSEFPYLYGPVGVLLFINLLFFASTVVHLRKIHNNTEVARSSSTLEDKKGVKLIAKLFVVMGVLWIFEFVSWAASYAFPDSESVLIYVFMPTDILNSLQGVAIFVIFICKADVWSKLKAKTASITANKNSLSVSTVYYDK